MSVYTHAITGNTVLEINDAAGDISTTASMTVGDFFHGDIETLGEADWIAIELEAGAEYTFSVAGTDALMAGLRNSFLQVRDNSGNVVASNDDILPGVYYYSSVTYTADTAGTYYVDVQGDVSYYTGSYGVSVTEGDIASYDALMGAGMLLSPNASWSTTPGGAATVSWGIRATGTEPASGSPLVTPSITQASTIQDVLGYASNLCGLTLAQVNTGGTTDSATMLFGAYEANDGRAAYAFYPDIWGANSPNTSFESVSGDVWLNNSYLSTDSLEPGSFSHFVLMHEFAHAVGLSHPGPYNAGDGPITYENNAMFLQDSHQYTIMSYFDETATGASSGLGYPDTFMLLDILALHNLYGANINYNSGTTVYGFNTTDPGSVYDFSSNTTPFLSIYDGGGTDTIDLSNYSSDQLLSLVEGVFSNVGGYVGNFSIAYGSTIENAIGGSGNDFIIGNDVANGIDGGMGNDTIVGGLGADTITAGHGDDVVDATQGADIVHVYPTAGSDILAHGNPDATLHIYGHSYVLTSENTVITSDGATVSFNDFGNVHLHCFCSGTHIATPRGDVPVEALASGDLVTLASGEVEPIIWIGRQNVFKAVAGPSACPVRVRAGALGHNVPVRDLFITEDHGVLINGLLINAKALINGTTIKSEPISRIPDCFTVYHIETMYHDFILAEGAIVETYLSNPGREAFDNASEYYEKFGYGRKIKEHRVPRISSARLLPLSFLNPGLIG